MFAGIQSFKVVLLLLVENQGLKTHIVKPNKSTIGAYSDQNKDSNCQGDLTSILRVMYQVIL